MSRSRAVGKRRRRELSVGKADGQYLSSPTLSKIPIAEPLSPSRELCQSWAAKTSGRFALA